MKLCNVSKVRKLVLNVLLANFVVQASHEDRPSLYCYKWKEDEQVSSNQRVNWRTALIENRKTHIERVLLGLMPFGALLALQSTFVRN